MKMAGLLTAIVMMFSVNVFAKPFIYKANEPVQLKGTLARMFRPNVDAYDKELIEKCGPTYLALILEEPISVERESMETGEKIVEQVYQLKLMYGSKISKGLDKVSGRVDTIDMGSCNHERFGIFQK